MGCPTTASVFQEPINSCKTVSKLSPIGMTLIHWLHTIAKLEYYKSCWHVAIFHTQKLVYMLYFSTSGPVITNIICNFLNIRAIDVEATTVSPSSTFGA